MQVVTGLALIFTLQVAPPGEGQERALHDRPSLAPPEGLQCSSQGALFLVCWDKHVSKPDIERWAFIRDLVYSEFPTIKRPPPIRVYVHRYADYLRRRSEVGLDPERLTLAFTYRHDHGGFYVVETWFLISDRVLAHEFAHQAFFIIAPKYNVEEAADWGSRILVTNPRYQEWLKKNR